MVPWFELMSWPLDRAFENLRKETTRIITNFHWAYEGYTFDRLQLGDQSPFKECLKDPERFATIKITSNHTAFSLAHRVGDASIKLSSNLGSSEVDFFGGQLMQREVDFTA